MEASTRERLVRAAMKLFGERGYRATKVGDIEAAAGLSPRAGAFYRHFPSKQAVLEVSLDRWVADVSQFPDAFASLLPLGDLRAELTVIARGSLQVLGRQRELFRVLSHGVGDVPGFAERVHAELISRGYRQMAGWLGGVLGDRGRAADQAEALAAVAIGALVHYCEDRAVYGTPPAGVGEDDFVDAWVDLLAAFLGPG